MYSLTKVGYGGDGARLLREVWLKDKRQQAEGAAAQSPMGHMGKKSHWKGGSSDAGLTEAVPSSSLGIYKAQLMKSLSNLIYLKLDLL